MAVDRLPYDCKINVLTKTTRRSLMLDTLEKNKELLKKLKSKSSEKKENFTNFVPADNLNGKATLYAPF